MPRYDFQCEAGHRFELELPFGSPMEQPCARCGKPSKRGFHTPLFRYRGMGFYTTDTRKNRRKPEKDPESSARTPEPPPGEWPKAGETKHGVSDAPAASGSGRASRSRSGNSSERPASRPARGAGGADKPADGGTRRRSKSATS